MPRPYPPIRHSRGRSGRIRSPINDPPRQRRRASGRCGLDIDHAARQYRGHAADGPHPTTMTPQDTPMRFRSLVPQQPFKSALRKRT